MSPVAHATGKDISPSGLSKASRLLVASTAAGNTETRLFGSLSSTIAVVFKKGTVILDSRWIVFVAAISGLLCVGIGAMGSHSLPKRLQAAGLSELDVQKKLGQCEIAVKYKKFDTSR